MGTHVRYHDYFTEISLCDRDDCGVCRKFGSGLRTPDSPIGRYTLLRPMDRPVKDPMNQGHFVPASLTASFISEKNLSFEKLKAVLPDTGKQTLLTEAQLADRKADKDAGGSDLFKGQNVRILLNVPSVLFQGLLYQSMRYTIGRLHCHERKRKHFWMSLRILKSHISVVILVLLMDSKQKEIYAVEILSRRSISPLLKVKVTKTGPVTCVVFVATVKISSLLTK